MVVHMSLSMLSLRSSLVRGGDHSGPAYRARAGSTAGGRALWVTQILHWRLLRVLYHPAFVFIIFIGSYYGLYFTPYSRR